jgi:hypothetical protein
MMPLTLEMEQFFKIVNKLPLWLFLKIANDGKAGKFLVNFG